MRDLAHHNVGFARTNMRIINYRKSNSALL